MTFSELKAKAAGLPLEPGVYIMRDKEDRVIYVGKAKKLRNRVSQYFMDSVSHSPKTRLMVSKIDHFDVFVTSSEFEALVLECSQIKRYMPKYNILLKDDKGYPYIRLNKNERFPKLTISNRIENDGAEYFGPYGSRGITQGIIDAIVQTLGLPSCTKQFPRDLGKGRPCLQFHMNQCSGWCQNRVPEYEYMERIDQAKQLLLGNYKHVTEHIKEQMLAASEDLNFELAAALRDRLKSVQALNQKQLVTAGTAADMDVIGYGQTETKACFAVLHFHEGNLMDKDYEVFSCPDDPEAAVSALMKQYYLSRGLLPKIVLLPFAVEDSELFSQMIQDQYAQKMKLFVPQRGEKTRFVDLANKNAYEEALRITTKEERISGTLVLLAKMLSVDPPKRIESYDISNISGTDIVASMVVFQDGKPKRSDYKRFKIEDLTDQDDYRSMHQVILRRFLHYVDQDNGFSDAPNLILIDGGVIHAGVAEQALSELNLSFPVFGMVKDNRHRTRALVTSAGKEIRIDNQQSVFSLIGNIQEETHRFAITYHRQLRSKRLRYSELDSIAGIGPKRKEELLRKFLSITAIRNASLVELEKYLPRNAAMAVYRHFHPEVEGS